jgi:pimeloyl-ACP methyl ester carboxylesterase
MPFRLRIFGAKQESQRDGFQPVKLMTSRGEIACHYYAVPEAQHGAIWVGGAGGGWDTPARGLYPYLAAELRTAGIASLRIRYRHPNHLAESVADVLAGIDYLRQLGIKSVALIGHSFGGAVVIQAAAQSDITRTVVTLATQSYGSSAVAQFRQDCSILLIHGTGDRVLPPFCSESTYRLAHGRKQIEIFQGAGHGLEQVAGEIFSLVRGWIVEELKVARPV